MGLFREFRDFIVRGNAIDLAVGIIIGAAFGAMVKSLVDDVMMPPLGYLMGGVDFADKVVTLADPIKKGEIHPITQLEAPKDIPAVVISYGKFINAVIALLIQGFAIFLVVKFINTARKRLDAKKAVEAAAPAVPPADVQLLTEIRDLLKTRS